MSGKRVRKDGLVFDGSFESGNISKVERHTEYEYDVYIGADTCNPRHRLWFFFSVTCAHEGHVCLFHIVNFSKTRSLYRLGMSPVVCSTRRPNWQRMPERSCFYYRFLANETYFFAYCFPYGYTFLQRYLCGIAGRNLPFFKVDLLCRTVQRRRVDIITIGSNEASEKPKKTVVVTARVHPGETPASYICHGLLEFLTSDSPHAKVLRDNVVFKIIPMMNPDGVFLGNYRCNSLGFDLNRVWLNPAEWCHPTVYSVRKLLMDLDATSGLELFIDIHSHSTGTNAFMYINGNGNGSPESENNMLFPRLYGVNCKYFSAPSSKVCKMANKAGTGRRALGDFVGIKCLCYTLEVSFFCAVDDRGKKTPFSQQIYIQMGKDLGLTLVDYYRLK